MDLHAFLRGPEFYDFDALRRCVCLAVITSDRLLDIVACPVQEAADYLTCHRPVSVGAHGLADALAHLGCPLDSPEGLHMNMRMFESMYHSALETSLRRAHEHGPYPAWDRSPTFEGELFVDMWPSLSGGSEDFTIQRIQATRHGLRNATLICQPSRAYFPTLQEQGSGAQPYLRCVLVFTTDRATDRKARSNFVEHSFSGISFRTLRYTLARALSRRGRYSGNIINEIEGRNGTNVTLCGHLY